MVEAATGPLSDGQGLPGAFIRAKNEPVSRGKPPT